MCLAGPEQLSVISRAAVSFRGVCNAREPTRGEPVTAMLGRTHVSNATILPFANAYCDAIHNSIATKVMGMSPQRREFYYARSVGRVLGHELYHILTGELHHGSEGIAQATFAPNEMLADSFRF
jgi:hypothetical protein